MYSNGQGVKASVKYFSSAVCTGPKPSPSPVRASGSIPGNADPPACSVESPSRTALRGGRCTPWLPRCRVWCPPRTGSPFCRQPNRATPMSPRGWGDGSATLSPGCMFRKVAGESENPPRRREFLAIPRGSAIMTLWHAMKRPRALQSPLHSWHRVLASRWEAVVSSSGCGDSPSGKEKMGEDRDLTCGDCGETFVFTEKDQEFFSSKGFQDPKRCPACRRARKSDRGEGGGGYGGGRKETEVVCADCGMTTTVPFEPKGDRPVYCRECFNARK